MKQEYEEQIFTLPLSFEAHSVADKYWRRQDIPERAKQVYVTELAVYAVDKMLQHSGIDTDWSASHSSDSLFLQFANVGDLVVTGVGKLECCPVLPGNESFEISSEAWEDRVGYVAVKLDQSLKQAKILGFVSAPAKVIDINQLSPLNELFPYLASFNQSEVNLIDWIRGTFDQSWKTVEEVLSSEQHNEQYEFAFRKSSEISRGKIIDLGMQLGREPVALVVAVSSTPESNLDIWVRVCPIKKTYLTSGVKLIFTDDSNNIFEVESRETDIYIQDEYEVEPGEQFSITVSLDNVSITTEFTT
ncbi:MAG: DUF1822 family protein [Cyanobacteria bacterium P01_D01_bin.56]